MSLYKYSILSFNRRKNSWGKYFPEITMTEFVDSLPLCFQRNKLLSDGSDCEESDCSAGDSGLIPGLERSLGVGNGNLLQDSCWKTPWTEEPGGLQSMEFQRVRHDWVANIFTFIVIMFSEGWVVWEVITCVFSYCIWLHETITKWQIRESFFFSAGHLVFRCYCSHQDVLKNQASYFFLCNFQQWLLPLRFQVICLYLLGITSTFLRLNWWGWCWW